METGSSPQFDLSEPEGGEVLIQLSSSCTGPASNLNLLGATLPTMPCSVPAPVPLLSLGAPQIKAELKVQDPNIRTGPDVVLVSEGKMFEDFRVHIWILCQRRDRGFQRGTGPRAAEKLTQQNRSSAGVQTSDRVHLRQKTELVL